MKLTEEHQYYEIDCTKAEWATDSQHKLYNETTACALSDVDWIIETKNSIMLVEYKNGNVYPKSNYNPAEDKKIVSVVKKYYDTLHYINLLNKAKPRDYIYILEYPNGDSVSRKMLRNRIIKLLPFELQKNVNSGTKIINSFDVLSIDEWNEKNSDYPVERTEKPLSGGST